MEETFGQMRALTASKGEEYSRSDDQLANFKRSAEEAGVTPQQVWLVFYNKHMDAIKHFIKTGFWLSTEKPEARIDDAILYLLLLKAMIKEHGPLTASELIRANRDFFMPTSAP